MCRHRLLLRGHTGHRRGRHRPCGLHPAWSGRRRCGRRRHRCRSAHTPQISDFVLGGFRAAIQLGDAVGDIAHQRAQRREFRGTFSPRAIGRHDECLAQFAGMACEQGRMLACAFEMLAQQIQLTRECLALEMQENPAPGKSTGQGGHDQPELIKTLRNHR